MKAVVFDCDGVLINSEELCLDVELACLNEIGLAFERHEYVSRFMGMTSADFYAALDGDLRAKFGRPLPETFPGLLHERTWALVETSLACIPGAPETVQALTVPMAVASGSNPERLVIKLRKVGLFDRFAPHIYSAQDMPRGKPAPDVYLHAAKQLGVDPAACIAVEDSANGVTSARAAGMVVVGFTGGGHCPPRQGELLRGVGASHIAADMDQLLAILRGAL
jgi:HAD superfamily hydrolase (TIGR01509 family)